MSLKQKRWQYWQETFEFIHRTSKLIWIESFFAAYISILTYELQITIYLLRTKWSGTEWGDEVGTKGISVQNLPISEAEEPE